MSEMDLFVKNRQTGLSPLKGVLTIDGQTESRIKSRSRIAEFRPVCSLFSRRVPRMSRWPCFAERILSRIAILLRCAPRGPKHDGGHHAVRADDDLFAIRGQIVQAAGMSSFPLSADKLAALERRMSGIGVRESDFEETFVRSGGPGGQNVNKSSSCVMLLHRPTGLRVKCQTTRHQGLNRFLARRLLLDKIERMQKGYVEAERARIEKVRRQKRTRSPRAKERMLADKARLGEKKRLRGAVALD